jgi:hypothetical protein
MVAPIDAKEVLKAGGDELTLRLNFRSISLLEESGLDLFSEAGVHMTLAKSALLVKCLAVTDHPALTEDEALAIVVADQAAVGRAVLNLIARFGGKAEEEGEGNGRAAKAAA